MAKVGEFPIKKMVDLSIAMSNDQRDDYDSKYTISYRGLHPNLRELNIAIVVPIEVTLNRHP